MRELYVDTREGAACFRTISEAVASLPSENEELTVIHVAPGIYEERLTIETPFIVLEGSGAQQTRVTGNLGAYELLEDGTKRGTFRTQTVLVHTHDFTARNITFENTAGPGRSAGQAIALYADGDRLLFENVDLVGFQDTLFTGPLPLKELQPGGFRGPLEHSPRINGRQHYKNCRIFGTVDFIFGSATAYFEDCELISLNDRKEETAQDPAAESGEQKEAAPVLGYVTAPSTPQGQKYGYVFKNCAFTGPDCPDGTCYLGRPWRNYARCVLIDCKIGRHIRKEGWHDWGKERAEETTIFAEYGCVFEDRDGAFEKRPADEGTSEGLRLRKYLREDEVCEYAKEKVLG